MLKNRNDADIFPDADDFDDDHDDFFARIYRTPLFDEFADECARLLTLRFPA